MHNDTELVERAQQGDLTAFKELVTGHKKMVYYLAYDLTRNREDAEDVSQEVFVKAYRSLKSFRLDAKFSSWLYRITVNTCLSLKSRKSYSTMKTFEEIGSSTEPEAGEPGPERETEFGFIRSHVEQALSKLSKREKAIFIMRNYSGMSFQEIVEILKIKPATARNFNFKALRKLRKELAFYKKEI
ncbi:MAG: RNA polymerase sigma factor [Ignavibacteriales bacterium]|nr:RNA polymerase sigma factor [Ignavibacteriales bacterium]